VCALCPRHRMTVVAATGHTVPLIDVLKEAVLRTGCLNAATSAATCGDLDPGFPGRAAAGRLRLRHQPRHPRSTRAGKTV
jgi:hypothetical protein